jgi:hypothetical protein
MSSFGGACLAAGLLIIGKDFAGNVIEALFALVDCYR